MLNFIFSISPNYKGSIKFIHQQQHIYKHLACASTKLDMRCLEEKALKLSKKETRAAPMLSEKQLSPMHGYGGDAVEWRISANMIPMLHKSPFLLISFLPGWSWTSVGSFTFLPESET